MTTKTLSKAPAAASGVLPIFAVALIGLMTIFVAGHAQSATLHDSAHDVRHATGFPCH